MNNIKFVWFVAIVCWLFLIMHIVLPFTGAVEREWDSMIIWTAMSTMWTNILVSRLKDKQKENDSNN